MATHSSILAWRIPCSFTVHGVWADHDGSNLEHSAEPEAPLWGGPASLSPLLSARICMSLWGQKIILPIRYNINWREWERGRVCLTLLYPPESARPRRQMSSLPFCRWGNWGSEWWQNELCSEMLILGDWTNCGVMKEIRKFRGASLGCFFFLISFCF